MLKYFKKRKSNQEKFNEEISEIKKRSIPIPKYQQDNMQAVVESIVRLIGSKTTDGKDIGLRFYIENIIWEKSSKDLPTEAYVFMFNSDGITNINSLNRKIYDVLENKYQSRLVKAEFNSSKIDVVTRN